MESAKSRNALKLNVRALVSAPKISNIVVMEYVELLIVIQFSTVAVIS